MLRPLDYSFFLNTLAILKKSYFLKSFCNQSSLNTSLKGETSLAPLNKLKKRIKKSTVFLSFYYISKIPCIPFFFFIPYFHPFSLHIFMPWAINQKIYFCVRHIQRWIRFSAYKEITVYKKERDTWRNKFSSVLWVL